ncbi:RNase P/MRP, p29 subunit [Amylostereum chailletii]|nr:RNase P/MRP, p29 subunit [Amylostereum chailletii]
MIGIKPAPTQNTYERPRKSYAHTLPTGRIKYSSDIPFTPQYVQSSLTVDNSAALYNERVRRRQILLENPHRISSAKQDRTARRLRRQEEMARKKSGVMGRKEAAQKGVWKLKKEQTKYDLFVPLHRMWMDYMSELLSLSPAPSSGQADARAMPSSAGMHAKLVKADFHGSIMTVRQSKNPCLVELSGIVIHETENAFRVITKKNQLKLIPKHGSVFGFAVPLYSTTPSPTSTSTTEAPSGSTSGSKTVAPPEKAASTVLDSPHIEFELYGNQFQYRSAEHVGRKFKHKETIEL